MEFKDFEANPKELIGKLVVYESGQVYSKTRVMSLHHIWKVTKTGFRLVGKPTKLFRLKDGQEKGLNGRMNMSTISICRLVSEDEANQLKELWKQIKEERALREKMQEKLKTMTFEQLKKMELL